MKHRFLVEIANTTLTYVKVDAESVGDIHNLFHEGGTPRLIGEGLIVNQKIGEDIITKVSFTNGQPDRSQCA